MRQLPALLLSALVLLPACGGGAADPKEQVDAGYTALGSGDYASAASDLGAALAALEESDPQWMRAKKGHLRALAHTDGGQAASDMVAFAGSHDVSLDDWVTVAGAIVEGGDVEASKTVLKAAWAEHPDEKALKRVVLDALVAEKAGGGEGGLEDLGYTSGGDPDAALEDPQFLADLAEFLGT